MLTLKTIGEIMKKLANLEELFHHQLRDIYSAETQIFKILPEMIEKANSKKLKKVISDHLEETENQVRRLEQISKENYLKLSGYICEAMMGLIMEAKSFISEDTNKHVRDAGMIADLQRLKHYEISAYGTVIEYAKALGENEIAKKLEKSLREESNTDKILTKLAKDSIHAKVKVSD